MRTVEEFFSKTINDWGSAKCKGKGTAIVAPPVEDRLIILGVLQRIYIRCPTSKVLIVTNSYKERSGLATFLTTQEDSENNDEFKKCIANKLLKIVSSSLIEENPNWNNSAQRLLILYHVENISLTIQNMAMNSKFILGVYNRLIADEQRKKLYQLAPILSEFTVNEANAARCNIPIKEICVPVTISEIDRPDYDRLNDFVSSSISIFGSLNVIDYCRRGDSIKNISAIQMCGIIATDNGWSENLDMSIGYNRQVDAMYSPINLKKRADETYNVIRERIKFCSDYKGKLDEIVRIVKENKDKKILIINKRGEFANEVTNSIYNAVGDICANYHNDMNKIPAVDDEGNPVYFKTGVNSGKQKFMAAAAQRTYNERRFNLGKINVLSANAAPDKNLTINVDVVIITSPLCEEMENYIFRLGNVRFVNNHLKLYTLYCKNTIEEKKISEKRETATHTIVGSDKNVVGDNEINGFILVD